MVVFTVLLWLLCAAGALLVVLMLPPIHLWARVGAEGRHDESETLWDRTALAVRVSGLLGAFRLGMERRDGALEGELRVIGFKRPVGTSERANVAETPEARRKRTSGAKGDANRDQVARPRRRRSLPIGPFELLQLAGELRWLLGQMLRRLALKVDADLVYGFADPATTGMVYGAIAAMPLPPRIKLEPNYFEETIEGFVEVRMRVYPLQAFLLVLRFALRRPIRRLWWPRIAGIVRNALRIGSKKRVKKSQEVVTT